MKTFLPFIIFILTSVAVNAQVVVSDVPLTAPADTNKILTVESKGNELFTVTDSSGVYLKGGLSVDSLQIHGSLRSTNPDGLKLHGYLEVDSATIKGPLVVSNNGGSFVFLGNKPLPPPMHDLMRVTTNIFTVTGGFKTTQPLIAMGVNTEVPNNMLDVQGGDIDVNQPTFGYMIGDQYVLRHKGSTDNIYVGVDAGQSLITGQNLTFVGSGAGQNVGSANDFTLIGYQAGFSNLGGSTNTFIGSKAGFSEMGDENVYVGWMSGHNNNQAGFHNTFVGNVSGFNNLNGNNNTFIGIGSGLLNANGSDNVALGAGAGMGLPALFNAAAIGYNTVARNNNDMILGNNNNEVGIGLSNATVGPQNKLEIDAGINGMLPTLAGNVGASGLRLRDLHDLTLPVANIRNVVLSVDSNGDVILVNAPGSSAPVVDNGLSTSGPSPNAAHLGQSVGAAGDPAQLLDNREIPMYGFNIYFNGDAGANQDMVEIGDNTILALSPLTGTKLNVQTQTEQSAGKFVNRTNLLNPSSTYGVQGIKLMGVNVENIGVYGYAETDPTSTAPAAIGVKGLAKNQVNPANGTPAFAYGVWGEASDNATSVNYGGYFLAANGTGSNYAVYGDALGIGGAPGPGVPAGPTFAGFFNGDVYITNTYGPSDQKLKQNIQSLDGAVDLLMQLKPKTYSYRRAEFPSMALPSGKQYGLLAQEVESILPELVKENRLPAKHSPDGQLLEPAIDFKSLDYEELIPILVKAIQEQQAQIDRQDEQLRRLSEALINR